MTAAPSNRNFTPASINLAAADKPVIEPTKSLTVVAANSAAQPVPVVVAGETAALDTIGTIDGSFG